MKELIYSRFLFIIRIAASTTELKVSRPIHPSKKSKRRRKFSQSSALFIDSNMMSCFTIIGIHSSKKVAILAIFKRS